MFVQSNDIKLTGPVKTAALPVLQVPTMSACVAARAGRTEKESRARGRSAAEMKPTSAFSGVEVERMEGDIVRRCRE